LADQPHLTGTRAHQRERALIRYRRPARRGHHAVVPLGFFARYHRALVLARLSGMSRRPTRDHAQQVGGVSAISSGSPLEEAGFEPLVPRKRLVSSCCRSRSRRLFCWCGYNRHNPISKACVARGPMVRIRLPPPVSPFPRRPPLADCEWAPRRRWQLTGSDAAKPRGLGWSDEGGGRGDLTIGQSGRANTPLRRHHLPPAYFPPSITSSVLVK
jgi:hypothetical protein